MKQVLNEVIDLRRLDQAFEFKRTVFDIFRYQSAFGLCFGICRDGDGLLVPVKRVAVGRDIGDVMRRQKISEAFHGFEVVRHDDIHIGR